MGEKSMAETIGEISSQVMTADPVNQGTNRSEGSLNFELNNSVAFYDSILHLANLNKNRRSGFGSIVKGGGISH